MNRRASIIGIAFLIGVLFTVGTIQGTSKTTIALGPTSPLSTPNPRQGVAAASFPTSQPYLSQLGSWATVWGPYDGLYPTTFQLVPMLVKSQALPSLATVQSIDAKTDHDYWLVFNECENFNQCRKYPADQAQFYHDYVLPLVQAGDPNAKLIIGGTSAHECGLSWLTKFVEAYRSLYHEDPPRAGWHFHIYPDVVPDPTIWQPGQPCPDIWSGAAADHPISITDYVRDAERFRRWWSLYGSPIDEVWVSETGCLVPTLCPDTSNTAYIAAITAYLNNEGRWVDRYAWYTDYDGIYTYRTTWLMTDATSGQFTGIGTYYSHVVPAAHVPGFQYLSFLPIVLNTNNSGSQAMIGPSPFASPLPRSDGSTFDSPLPLP